MIVKKQFVKTIVLLIAAISINVTAFAQDVAGTYDTDVEISFLPGNEITPPVDPDQPDIDTGEPGTNQPGPLSIDWVPTLAFGSTHTVTAKAKSYNTIAERPYIQVTDLRGSGSGWKVTAALSGFTNNSSPSLKGAYIKLTNGSAKSATVGIEPPVPADPVILTSDGEDDNVAIASGLTQAGRGTWVVRWYPVGGSSDVTLTVPAAAAGFGTHTATITWTLYDAP